MDPLALKSLLSKIKRGELEYKHIYGYRYIEQLEVINVGIDHAISPYEDLFRQLLRDISGTTLYEHFEQNHSLVAMIQETADRLRLLFECPKCGRPAKLRCRKPGRSKSGIFQFDHVIDGKRTSHGGSSDLPVLTLIPDPRFAAKRAKPIPKPESETSTQVVSPEPEQAT